MSRLLTYVGIGFLLLLIGFPVPQVANGIGFLLIAFGAISTIVSATELAKKAFAGAIGFFAVGQVFPVLRSIAWSVAPFVFVCLILGVAAYVAGVRAWKRLTSDRAEPERKAERPKIRARADPAATYELPEVPRADETKFDLFGARKVRR